MNPFFTAGESLAYHQERLDTVERLQQARNKRSKLVDRMRLYLGERLIAWGMQLKPSAQQMPQLD